MRSVKTPARMQGLSVLDAYVLLHLVASKGEARRQIRNGGLRANDVVITDENAVPPAFKDVMLTMPAHVWEALLERLGNDERACFEGRIKKTDFKPDKRALASELKDGSEIRGADLKFGDFRLVIG